MAAAAFFDLDRTLLRRSSALALAGSFRERGLISRCQIAAGCGVAAPLRRARREPRGGAARRPRTGCASSPATRPRTCASSSPRRWSRCCVRSSTPSRCASSSSTTSAASGSTSSRRRLQEIVDAIAEDLGFDGALGTVIEVQRREVHRSRRAGAPCRGQGRLRARARRARGLRPRRSARRTPTATPTSRSSKPSGIRSRQSGSRAAADRGRARLAGARVQRPRLPARARVSRPRSSRPVRGRGHRRHEARGR